MESTAKSLSLSLACAVALGCGADPSDEGDGLDDIATESECKLDSDCGDGRECSATSTCMAAGGCATSLDCGEGYSCSSFGACVIDLGCSSGQIDIPVGDPHVLVALDRSCSMKGKIDGVSKWDSAVPATQSLVTSTEHVAWGLTLFPDQKGDGKSCDMEEVPIPVERGTGAVIADLLGAALSEADINYPDDPCVTPIDAVSHQARASLESLLLRDPHAAPVLVLVTDGANTCDRNGGKAAIKANIDAMRQQGILTMVVGFGGNVSKSALNTYAELGGAALPGHTKYLQADTGDDLARHLESLGERFTSCRFEVRGGPYDVSAMRVFAGEQPLLEGWTYHADAGKVELDSETCAEVRASGVTTLTLGLECPPVE